MSLKVTEEIEAKNENDFHISENTGQRIKSDKNVRRCMVCMKEFGKNSNLIQHMRTHTGEGPFHCDVCGCNFSVNFHLLRHMKTHTGEKPFHFDICGSKFAQKSHLRSHLQTLEKNHLYVRFVEQNFQVSHS